MDRGKIKLLVLGDKENASIMCDLESLEEIEENEKIISITPYQSSRLHLIKIRDFIRFNIDKEEYINPHNRNQVIFSEEDLEVLKIAKQTEINILRALPNEVFVKLLEILKSIIDKKIAMFYFPSIINILNLLLGVIPQLNSLDETLGSYEPEITNMNFNIQKEIKSAIENIEEELGNEENVQRCQLHEECILLPYEIKSVLNYTFERLVGVIEKVILEKKETEFSKKILTIFLDLDSIRGIFESFGPLIFNNPILQNKTDNILITISDNLQKLETLL